MDEDVSSVTSEKRSSPTTEDPPPKRLKEDDDDPKDAHDGDDAKLCPTLKRSENHGITEYVSKAHNGFFGECFCLFALYLVSFCVSAGRLVFPDLYINIPCLLQAF